MSLKQIRKRYCNVKFYDRQKKFSLSKNTSDLSKLLNDKTKTKRLRAKSSIEHPLEGHPHKKYLKRMNAPCQWHPLLFVIFSIFTEKIVEI